jgi:hypothetical protein
MALKSRVEIRGKTGVTGIGIDSWGRRRRKESAGRRAATT